MAEMPVMTIRVLPQGANEAPTSSTFTMSGQVTSFSAQVPWWLGRVCPRVNRAQVYPPQGWDGCIGPSRTRAPNRTDPRELGSALVAGRGHVRTQNRVHSWPCPLKAWVVILADPQPEPEPEPDLSPRAALDALWGAIGDWYESEDMRPGGTPNALDDMFDEDRILEFVEALGRSVTLYGAPEAVRIAFQRWIA